MTGVRLSMLETILFASKSLGVDWGASIGCMGSWQDRQSLSCERRGILPEMSSAIGSLQADGPKVPPTTAGPPHFYEKMSWHLWLLRADIFLGVDEVFMRICLLMFHDGEPNIIPIAIHRIQPPPLHDHKQQKGKKGDDHGKNLPGSRIVRRKPGTAVPP
jgi:hypothetical protein